MSYKIEIIVKVDSDSDEAVQDAKATADAIRYCVPHLGDTPVSWVVAI